ncbi:MAG: PKD domain-containing protein [Planctomycetes bacterium]|nr:PKD domain-containing protein [Planctomycetota bacterium]
MLAIAALDSGVREPGVVARYSIRLGDVKEFDRDVTLEFAYDPARAVEGLPVGEQYAISYYDERVERWRRVPFEVDAARRRLVVRTRHLSDWEEETLAGALYDEAAEALPRILKTVTLRSLDSAGNERDATVTFWMRTGDNIPTSVSDAALIRRNEKNPLLKHRVEPAGPLDKYAMPFGEVAVSYFEMIWETYHAARFRLPAAMDVYVTLAPGESPYYKSITGTMSLPSALESLTELKANLAHEMFHVVQNQYLNGASMFYMRAWWMDVTADYAAAQVAWGGDAEIWKSVTQFLKPYYLEHSIAYFSEVKLAAAEAAAMPTVADSDAAKCARDRFHNHHYQTCVFVDHLVRKGGVDFHEMMEATLLATASNAVTPLDEYLRGKCAKKQGLFGCYRDFAADWLFATDSRIPGGGGGTTVDRSMNRSDTLTEDAPEAEWKVSPEPLYSAKCWEIRAARPGKAASKVVLTLVSQPEAWIGSARVYLLKGRKRVPDPAAASVALLDSYSTEPVSVELAPDDGLFVMVYTGDDCAWELGFKAQMRGVAIRRPFAEVEKGVVGAEYAFGIRKSAIPDDATFRWEFSDGGAGSGDRATHKYAAAGTYTVKVSAKWDGGEETDVTRVEIAPDVSAKKSDVSFCVYRKYKPPGVDPTTKNPWKASRYACQEFTVVDGNVIVDVETPSN